MKNALTRTLGALVMTGLTIGALWAWTPSAVSAASQEVIEQILVKVNGDIITKTDLEQRQIATLQRMKADVSPESLQNDAQLRKMLSEITPKILVDAIDELLLVQLGREKGLRLTDEMFNRWLANLRKEQNLEDEAKFQGALKQEGMTIADLRRNVERTFLTQEIQRSEVGSKLQITEEEARQYYQLHKEEFVEPSMVTLREILIEVPATTQQGQAGVNVAKDDQAAERAAEVRKRISGGEDFAKVASDVSAAPSKANGGLIGPIQVSELSPALQQLLEKMKPGDVTEPIRTARGYQLLKLETFKASAPQAFDSVRDVVADRVYSERQRVEVQRFLNRVRGQAIIVWKNDDLKKAYDQYVAAQQSGSAGN
jgi:peptidyl-prolyl cis-trans isomerase SurA